MEIQVDVIQGRGSPNKFGIEQAKKIRNMPLYKVHEKRRPKSLRSYNTDFKKAKQFILKFSPELWEEIEGVAEGLGWTVSDTLHEYGGYQQDWKKSGCSSVMINGIYGRNYDYHPKTYDGRFVLWQPESGKGYSTIGFAQRVIGRMDAMNEKGLAAGYHFVNRLRPSDGFICTTIARFVLNRCATVKEAVSLLKEIPHRHAFNYSLTDASGDTAIVEASGKGVEVHEGDVSGCTNHFEKKQVENRHRTAESISRLHRLNEYTETMIKDPDMNSTIFTILNHEKYGIAKRDYGNWSGTIHTAVYDTRNLSVLVGTGINGQAVGISFSDWLNGSNMYIRKLKGILPGARLVTHLHREGEKTDAGNTDHTK
ncbi:acyl-CoA--6-aminopenicillanic acid acyl-transferase [Alteribacter lacisalsi]|uniref:Acyl-CoA--6-aminopenicillanic acid acyl-transferase n=1 Tax=Alteribacter lacisalsi TaxID=2045244 RepID=A0A2W0H8V6_9BACI|nr:C45 family peptidase [Alteribacter lacisalsi]PYZ98284.1 acyl-CoA--6-aminopenicillanic acid acyl-transferase [Alteribacter lacisalsi]